MLCHEFLVPPICVYFTVYSALQLLEQYPKEVFHDRELSLTIMVAVLRLARFRCDHLDDGSPAFPFGVDVQETFYLQLPWR